ncbi:type II secretion system protein [Shewanella marina]|uniref:type II secretion system protein n=1 Tax=Shewanella marina TaxID=487319 RepID=UPI0004723799|nr:type II secretion system protein [Shewanella marina]
MRLRHSGFTLVELVTTIILISVLSVVVLPKLLSSSSFSAFTLRDEMISELRRVQMMAMNNIDRYFELKVTTKEYQLFVYQRDSDGSKGTWIRTEAPQMLPSNTQLLLKQNTKNQFMVSFNTLGLPVISADGHSVICNGACLVAVADDSQDINISSQGYIYANR